MVFVAQRVDILLFLEQSCSYITQFLRPGRLFNISAFRDAIGDATGRVLIGFHALLGADINWFIVRKWQDIMVEGFSNARDSIQEAFCYLRPVHLKQCYGCTRGIRFRKLYHKDVHVVRLTE